MELKKTDNFRIRKSFLEKIFLCFEPIIPHYLSPSVVMLSIYLIVDLLLTGVIFLKTGIWTYELNIFRVRDYFAAAIFPSVYVFLIDRFRALIKLIEPDVDLEKKEYYEFIEKKIELMFDDKKMILGGMIVSGMYLFLTTYYLISGYYSVNFYILRLISVIGTFVVGSMFYQALFLTKFFFADVRQVRLKFTALVNGLAPVSSFAALAVVSYILVITVLSLPTIVLGTNSRSLVWYISFYGTLYVFGIIIFLMFLWVFHNRMANLKKELILFLSPKLNQSFEIIKTRDQFRDHNLEGVQHWVELISAYEKVLSGKEWPINWKAARDVFISYILPMLLSIIKKLGLF